MKNIHCKVFGHDYRVSRNVTYHVKEYTCKNCKNQLTTNGSGNLIELTPKYKEINDVLERIHMKRHMIPNNKELLNINTTDELGYIPIKHKVKSSDQLSAINTENLLVFKH